MALSEKQEQLCEESRTTFLTWNLLHLARMLKDAGGIPAHCNQRSGWDAGERFEYENPEHRR